MPFTKGEAVFYGPSKIAGVVQDTAITGEYDVHFADGTHKWVLPSYLTAFSVSAPSEAPAAPATSVDEATFLKGAIAALQARLALVSKT
jgi:hypothetical protein